MLRGWALTLVGLWLGLLLASWFFAALNFRTVDRVLGPELRREADERFAGVAPAERRVLLRHLASESNRGMFGVLGAMQLVLALLVAALLWPEGGPTRVLGVAAAILLSAQVFGLATPIVDLGRAIDFAPRPLPADVGRRFGLLHAAYVGGDLVKAGLLVTLAWRLARRAGA